MSNIKDTHIEEAHYKNDYVEGLKELLRFDNCPEILIENPRAINHQTPSKETLEWANQVANSIENRKKEHPEDWCQRCGGNNPNWSADNSLFNEVNGSPNGIICPTCFLFMANSKGIEIKILKQ